jgi:hypothetical protein
MRLPTHAPHAFGPSTLDLHFVSTSAAMSLMGPELKIPKHDENDILKFDFEIEWACDASTSNSLERLTCSIAIERPRVFTQPGSKREIPG